jgi:pimeloyl-ACP methyl ester carboxylesterase
VFVQARAGRIYVDDSGIAECPAVFLHSLAGNTGHWQLQLDHARASGCGVAFDLRGHGHSDPPGDGDYSLEACADDLLAVLDAQGIDQCVLVGHSMGAGIATLFAASNGPRVRGLLLVDPVGDQRLAPDEMQAFLVALNTPYYDRIIRDYWSTIAGSDQGTRARVLADLENTPRRAVMGMLYALQRTDLTEAVRAYRGPKLAALTPGNDFPFSLHRVDSTIRTIVVDGTGHWLQLDAPDRFNRILDDFLTELQSIPVM